MLQNLLLQLPGEGCEVSNSSDDTVTTFVFLPEFMLTPYPVGEHGTEELQHVCRLATKPMVGNDHNAVHLARVNDVHCEVATLEALIKLSDTQKTAAATIDKFWSACRILSDKDWVSQDTPQVKVLLDRMAKFDIELKTLHTHAEDRSQGSNAIATWLKVPEHEDDDDETVLLRLHRSSFMPRLRAADKVLLALRLGMAVKFKSGLEALTQDAQQTYPDNFAYILKEKHARDHERLQADFWDQPKTFENVWNRIKPLDQALRMTTMQKTVCEQGSDSNIKTTVKRGSTVLKDAQTFASTLCVLNILINKAKRIKNKKVAESVSSMYAFLTKKVSLVAFEQLHGMIVAHSWHYCSMAPNYPLHHRIDHYSTWCAMGLCEFIA